MVDEETGLTYASSSIDRALKYLKEKGLIDPRTWPKVTKLKPKPKPKPKLQYHGADKTPTVDVAIVKRLIKLVEIVSTMNAQQTVEICKLEEINQGIKESNTFRRELLATWQTEKDNEKENTVQSVTQTCDQKG